MAEKTVISINKPTPKWATWMFRIIFNLTGAAAIWIGADGVLDDATKVKVLLGMKALDYFIWGIGKGLGVKKEDYSEN